jgi:hypothetical protein
VVPGSDALQAGLVEAESVAQVVEQAALVVR